MGGTAPALRLSFTGSEDGEAETDCGRGERATAPPMPIFQFRDVGFAALELDAEAVPQAP